MVKKVLITGSSGYIGSHLCKMLEKEYTIYGLDIRAPQAEIENFLQININQQFNIEEEFDCVIHLAALVNVGESEQRPISYYITNLNGTMNIVNKIKTKNFIFASTGLAEYCYDPYGTSKKAAEDVVKEFCTLHRQTPYSIFRFYNVIGSDGFDPTNKDGLMYNLMKACETGEFTVFGNDYDTRDGSCVRDYVHVNEICDALQHAIDNPSNSIECLGHGVGRTVTEIVNMFKKVNNVDFEVKIGPKRKGDLPSTVLEDVSPYMQNLYSLEELLKV